MKNLLKVVILVGVLSSMSINSHAGNGDIGSVTNPSDAEKVAKAINSARSILQQLYDNKQVTFKNAEDETGYVKAIMSLQTASSSVMQLSNSAIKNKKMDDVIEEARMTQKLLSGFFAQKGFHGYELKQGDIDIEVGAEGIFNRLVKKSLGNILGLNVFAGGRVRLSNSENIITQFNSIKTAFYGLLVEAANINPADSRLKALAEWGKDTEVVYPGESFGEKIIKVTEVWNLNLK